MWSQVVMLLPINRVNTNTHTQPAPPRPTNREFTTRPHKLYLHPPLLCINTAAINWDHAVCVLHCAALVSFGEERYFRSPLLLLLLLLLLLRRRCGGYLPAGVPGVEGAPPLGRAGEPAALQGAESGPGGDQEGHRWEAGAARHQPHLEQPLRSVSRPSCC